METRSKTKLAKTMADPKEANSDLTDLTSALQGLVTNLAQKEQRTVNITKVTNQAFKPDKYVPSLTESPKTWISKFESWIQINKFEDLGLIQRSLRLLLPEVDLPWFDSLTINSTKTMFDAFIDYYQSKQPTWLIEQTLWNKTMQNGEDLDQYISTIQHLANRLNKSDQEKTAAFVRGLPPYLRMSVIQKDPKTFEEAARCARLSQEAVTITSYSEPSVDRGSVPPEMKSFMERQQSCMDQLTQMMASINKSDSSVCAVQDKSQTICQLCDKPGHTAKRCFKNRPTCKDPIRCYNCGRTGHKQAECRSKRKN